MKEIYLIPILAAGLPMGALAAYQGVVYADRNANGQRDAGEVLMKDVAVSDGLHVVKTNGKGEFELPGHERARFVMVTVPNGCKADPFFQRIEEGKSQYDFGLLPNKKDLKGGEHVFLQITDTEISNTDQHDDWVNGLREYAKNEQAAFVIHTGDICYANGLKAHVNLMNTKNFPCPVYYCIGNHDLVSGKYGEELYESIYGPTFYSFDVGNTHYVVTPMLGGDYRPSYSQTDVAKWLKNDLAAAKGKQVIVFSHDLLTTGNEFKYGDVDLNAHHLKAWLYGHWHINHMRFQGEVFTMGTGTVDKGGIDHSTAAFREVRVDRSGYPASRLRHVYIDRNLCVASVQNGFSPLNREGNLPVSVNAYHAESPTVGVTCQVSVNGKKLPEVKLKEQTDWAWTGTVVMPKDSVGKKVQMSVKADFGHGIIKTQTIEFVCAGDEQSIVQTKTPWKNLLGNPQHDGIAQDSPQPPYQLAWTSNVGGQVLMASPLIQGNRVYVAAIDEDLKGRCGVFALDVRTGERLWRYPTRNSVKNTIALDGKTVLAQDVEGYLYAINAKTGMLRWEKQLPGCNMPGLIEGLAADNGIVYAGSGRGLMACSVKNGKELWVNSGWNRREGTTTTLSVGSGVVIAGSQWQALFANDAKTGKFLWRADANGLRNRGSSPVIRDGKAWLVSQDALFVMDAPTGKVEQYVKLPVETDGTSTPLLTEDAVIFGSSKAGLMALDKKTLKEKWRYETGDALVYTVPYTRKTSRSIETSPVLVGQSVIVTASDGTVSALEAQTGKLLWKASTGAPIFSSPAVSGNTVIVADYSGTVYAFTCQK